MCKSYKIDDFYGMSISKSLSNRLKIVYLTEKIKL
jgi:hypothetical protein